MMVSWQFAVAMARPDFSAAHVGKMRRAGPPDPQWLGALCARSGLEMDIGSVSRLIARFGVRFAAKLRVAPY